MRTNSKIPNVDCIGRSFVVCPENYNEEENDGYYDIYDSDGHILYMLGEIVEVTGVDEKRQVFAMCNQANDEEYENFEISFEQFRRDFGGAEN